LSPDALRGNGFDYDASARRLHGTYRREKVDHVPIVVKFPWGPHQDIDAAHFDDWRDEDSFRTLARLIQKHCDPRPPLNLVTLPPIWGSCGGGYQRFLEAPDEYLERRPAERVGEKRTRHTTVLHTPRGDLRWVYETDHGVLTNWDRERPIKCVDDVKRMLSVPYSFTPPDPAMVEPFRRHRAEKGKNALCGCGVNSMVAMICGMMKFELMLEWIAAEPGIIKELADAWLKRTGDKVDWLLSQGVGPIWHFNGVERATPPMIGPRQWERWVVPYDGEIMRRIKAADPESRIHVHCHGRVDSVLDSLVAMGVDSTDPVEPPPQGDVDLAAAKQKYDGKLVFFGNIEFADLETRTAGEIDALVRAAIEQGGKQNMVLCQSAGPHERMSDRCAANMIRFIEAGLEYGRM
jgi:hypothetical protein